MIVPATNGVDKDVDDLYGDHFTVALAQAMTRLECAPYWHSGEQAPARLVRAGELVRLSRVQLHDDRTATVHGSTKPYDLTGFHCTCPQSQKGQTMWCVHAVAVKLARTLASQAQVPDSAPDDDTLGNGYPVDDETLPLPLPPTSVEERLAIDPMTLNLPGEGLVTVAPDGSTTPYTPQEARMPADESEYIPEPEVSTTAMIEPKNGVSRETAVSTPATSSLDTRALLESMAAWKEQRQILARYIQEQLKDGVDYYTLRIKGRDTKPTLSKAGSEKFLAIFKMTATFQQDQATWTMLGSKEGVLCYTCTLLTRDGQVVGEGRGARTLAQDQGDINKAVKMAQKSAQIDAILRTGCLSDVFTQDINEPDEAPAAPPVKPTPTSQDMRQRIWKIVQYRAPEVKSREAVEAYIQEHTGMALHPDLYSAILARLEEAGR